MFKAVIHKCSHWVQCSIVLPAGKAHDTDQSPYRALLVSLGYDKVLFESKKNVLEIKNILCKLDKLKNKYDYLKDNYDFEYMLEINEGELVDNIIELKTGGSDD